MIQNLHGFGKRDLSLSQFYFLHKVLVIPKSNYLDLLLCEIVKLLLVMPHKISHTIMACGALLCWHDCAIQCVHHTAIIRGKTGLLRQNEQIYGLKVRCLEEMWMNHEGSCKLQ